MAEAQEGDSSKAVPRIIIIALGQDFRRDDAAGIHAVQYWLSYFPNRRDDQEIRVEFAGLPGINLMFLMEGFYAAILVDAMKSGAQPGTIRSIQVSDLESFSSGATSGHGWGAAETILLGQQLMPDKMPRQLVLIGIEAEDVSEGIGLSKTVEAVIPDAALAIEAYARNILSHAFEDPLTALE